jgi:zinc transport system substrate-binding protein
MLELTKRQLLAGAGAAALSLAGCTSIAGRQEGSADSEVTASFFVLGEFANAVAGDAVSVDTLVPFGQHGHGWEPSSGIQRTVFDSTAFVYVGEGFQPWADRVVENLRTDGADVTVIAARHGVDLLPTSGEHHEEHGDEHGDHEEEHSDDHDDHETGEHTETDHEQGEHDPHFWLDPTRAATAVSTVEAGLREVFPDHADTFAANAAAYRQELAALDEAFSTRLADRERDAVLVAGHNAFQYLAARYGFEVHGLTGISPDDSPSPQDIRRAQELIERDDITHILAPAFESDRAARQLVDETDAREVLPISAIPGITEAWHERGWGYLDVMREVNLTSLTTGLGA